MRKSETYMWHKVRVQRF